MIIGYTETAQVKLQKKIITVFNTIRIKNLEKKVLYDLTMGFRFYLSLPCLLMFSFA